MNSRFQDNPAFAQYERLLIRLHELIGAGNGDSEGAGLVRDQMDGPWKLLVREEADFLDGMSSDLYMLGDEEVSEAADVSERGPDTLGTALLEARSRSDWPRLLRLLRKGPTFLPKPTIAFLRGLAYLHLGHPEVALLFFDYAAKLNPLDLNLTAAS